MPRVRIRIDLAYDGADFHGWATQPGLRTVQGELRPRWPPSLRLAAVAVTCAGRTDTGVHARGQVVHVDVEPEALEARGRTVRRRLRAEALARRLNGLLAADVRVRRVAEAPPGFDARFSAVWRRYAYRIADAAAAVDPLTRGHVLAWPRPLDLDGDERRGRSSCSASTTSPPSASGARARRRCAGCSTCTGTGTPPGSPSRRCAPTRSATTWSARWSAACVAVGEGRRGRPTGPAAVLAAARARPGGAGRARARADPRGGRLPARRRAGRPGRA